MNAEITDNIVYGKGGDHDLEATLYRPEDRDDALPVIVWVHGGAWMGGTRHDDADYCRRIVHAGFACLAISYRFSQEATFPAQIEDCKCAVRYLRAHADELGILPDKIGAWGVSAGGHLVTLLGTSTNRPALEGDGGWPEYKSNVQAVCDWFGPTDLLQMARYQSDIDHTAADAPESLLIGGPVHENPEKAKKANPITYISAAMPPIYIAHGTKDRIVPFNQSELLLEALVAKGHSVTFEPMEGAEHGGHGFESNGPLVGRCIAFFKEQFRVVL